MTRQSLLLIICGLTPLFIIHLAYWLNVNAFESISTIYQCNPYLEGCVSISRAVRSGPGLIWFKVMMWPLAIALMFAWTQVRSWMITVDPASNTLSRWTLRLGFGGAIALVFYVTFLGTEGAVYSWLRRYGVVFFFGFTALAQLLVARMVWMNPPPFGWWPARLFLVIVSLQWLTGVSSVLKRLVFDDPSLINRLENLAEWLMIVLMSLGLVLIGWLMTRQKP